MTPFKTLNRRNSNSAKWESVKDKMPANDYLVFSVADSDYETAPEIKAALKARVEHGAFGYTMLDDDYYQIVQSWYQRRYQLNIKKNWIITAPKVLTALSIIIDGLSSKKAAIVIQTPVYNVFFPAIKQNGRKVVENKLTQKNGHYTMDIKDLEKHFKAGAEMLLLCSPHNPVGRIYTTDELARIVALCKQYGVTLVSDEIHADLVMPNHQFVSLGKFFNDYDNIILVSAPSKTFNLAGLQSANIVVPNNENRKKLKAYMRKRFLYAPNVLAIEAIKTAYTLCDDWVDAQNMHIYQNYQILQSFLNQYNPAITLTSLEGTYLAWIDFSCYQMKSDALNDHFMKFNVALASGINYGLHCDGYLRMNLACSKAQLEDGLRSLKKALDAL